MWILSTYFFMTVWQVCELFAQIKGSVSVLVSCLCSVWLLTRCMPAVLALEKQMLAVFR